MNCDAGGHGFPRSQGQRIITSRPPRHPHSLRSSSSKPSALQQVMTLLENICRTLNPWEITQAVLRMPKEKGNRGDEISTIIEAKILDCRCKRIMIEAASSGTRSFVFLRQESQGTSNSLHFSTKIGGHLGAGSMAEKQAR